MSDTVTVITNNVPRDVINGWELTADERAEFDYIDWAAVERGETSAEFFRYKGTLYDLHDCEGVHGGFGNVLPADSFLRAWDGWYSDTFFSGVLFRYAKSDHSDEERDWERVVVARYFS